MKKLERSIGLTAVVAISLSAMLGSGIFVLPGLAAAKTGPSIWLAYLLAGLCVLPAALSKAELATAMPASGGTYVYIVRTFGPLAGTVAGLGLWVSLMLKSAFALIGFGAYLVVLIDLPLKPTALVLLCAVVTLNVLGVRKVSTFQVVVVILAVAGLTTLVALGAPSFDGDRMSPFFTEGAGGFIGCAGFVFVSYAGVTKIAAIAEEVKDPDRNLPLGMLLILWFLIIRPQMRQQKQHRERVAGLQKGDEVVTQGGLVGKITKVEDHFVHVELAKGMTVKAVRTTIGEVLSARGKPAAND